MEENLKLPRKKNPNEEFNKGNGENCWPEEAYYFIKISHRIYLKGVYGKKEWEYNQVINTSNMIKYYIANATGDAEILNDKENTYFMWLRVRGCKDKQLIHRGVTILIPEKKSFSRREKEEFVEWLVGTKRKKRWFAEQLANTEPNDLVLEWREDKARSKGKTKEFVNWFIKTEGRAQEFNNGWVIQDALGILFSQGECWFLESMDGVKDDIVRHHILASDPYLEYMHDKNEHYSFSNDIAWAQGNLLLGPDPCLNYHDSGKDGKGHLSQKQHNKLTKAAGIILPKKENVVENSKIEAWVFNNLSPGAEPKHLSPGAKANIELIKQCANSYSSFKSSNDQELINNAFLEFAIAWQDLIKRPMLTGLWTFNVDNPTSIVKLQCERLFTIGEGISLKGSSIITELQRFKEISKDYKKVPR